MRNGPRFRWGNDYCLRPAVIRAYAGRRVLSYITILQPYRASYVVMTSFELSSLQDELPIPCPSFQERRALIWGSASRRLSNWSLLMGKTAYWITTELTNMYHIGNLIHSLITWMYCLVKSSYHITRVSTTWPFTQCQTAKIIARNAFCQLRSSESYEGRTEPNHMRKFCFMGQRLILFVRENYCNCASLGNSAQMSFSSAHTKSPNWGRANAFLTRANEL